MKRLESGFVKRVVWHDPDINNKENIQYFEFCFEDLELERFTDYKNGAEFLKNSNGKWIVITSGTKGTEFISLIHSLPKVSGIIVFCSDKSKHEVWTKKFNKISCVATEVVEVIEAITNLFDKQIVYGAFEGLENNEAVGDIRLTFSRAMADSVEVDEVPDIITYFHSSHDLKRKFGLIVRILSKEFNNSPDQVLKELVYLNPDFAVPIEKEFKRRSSDILKAILYSYSTDYLYSQFNIQCAAQKYYNLAFTLAACIKEIRDRPSLRIDPNITLYRGMRHGNCEKNYLVDTTVYWPAFTSTSQSIKIAKNFAGLTGLIFEIKLSKTNVHPHARLGPEWSMFPNEEEVLLFPHLAIKVVKKEMRDGLMWISLEQDENDSFFSLDEKKFIEYWENIVQTEISPKIETIPKIVNKVLTEFRIPGKFIDPLDVINTLDRSLKGLPCQEQNLKNEVYSIKRGTSLSIFDNFVEKVRDWFVERLDQESAIINKREKSLYYPFKLVEDNIFHNIVPWMQVTRPIIKKFVDTITQHIDVEDGEPLSEETVRSLGYDVLKQTEIDWERSREYVVAQIHNEVERIKPELNNKLKSYMD